MADEHVFSVIEADLDCLEHQQVVVELIDAYARDPMGNGAPLPADVRRDLLSALRRHPTTMIFLAYEGEKAIGIAVCFLGFSTFVARTLINVHDLAVLDEYRGRGVGRKLLDAIEKKAREMNCCKLTLEVQEYNRRARGLYEAMGFAQAVYVEDAGGTLFMAKPL